MKLDTTKQGINAVWKNYEAETISFLLDRGEKGANSGAVFKHVLFMLEQAGGTISRTSVIFFLNRLVSDGLANFTTRTGKGGNHRVYSLIDRKRTAFDASVIDKFLYKLGEIFPESDKLSSLVRS